MGALVVTGGSCACSFGTAPGNINVTSQMQVTADGKPVATIDDCSQANISPFGMCTTLTNPQVAAATAAALGVLTPQSCMRVPAGTWIQTNPVRTIGGKPVVTQECTCVCGYGGNISITSTGQNKVMAN